MFRGYRTQWQTHLVRVKNPRSVFQIMRVEYLSVEPSLEEEMKLQSATAHPQSKKDSI